MRTYTPTLLLLFAFLAGTTPLAFGQSPGQCNPGNAEKDLDVNNVLARMFNTGSLFFGNTTTAGDGYLVPKASGNSPIFASGIWIGGQADGELRVAGATYDDFEFWPGPLNDDGTLPNPNDCEEFDRIWKVGRNDILAFNATGVASADLATWPAELGAPVIAAPDNAFDDDGDGLIDEGTDEIDNDGDGFIDERDEQERVVIAVREAAGLPIYNLNAGDRPEIIGDQALWWVMNDVGNVHANTLSPPIGVEVRVLAFSFARADALNDVTFYQYTVVKKSPGTLEETYFSIFSDPDLGNAADDFVGVDTTLSLGFVYNGADTDANYGIPPATGYDFFQGPIVDADNDGEVDDTLGVTRFSYFSNIGSGPTSDPSTAEGIYNFMQGEWGDGVPMTEGGDGYATGGPVTLFAYPGDPVEEEFWSEVNVDGTGADNPPGDRRFLVTTGPFDLSQGDSQTIVFGIVFGQGTDRFNSITVLRGNDALAQAAYDADFELASAPPPPPLCNPNSPNAALRPGSGNCLEAVEIDGTAELIWGYPSTNPNYLGSYEVFDQLLAQQDVPDKTYNFEGFNIYRYPNANFEQGERELLATYDVINDVTTVIDTAFSAEIGDLVPFVALTAENTGVRYSFDLSQLGLTNYQDYYFGVTAFAHNFWSVPKIIESAASLITVRPSDITAGGGGSVAPAQVGETLLVQTGGLGRGSVFVEVVDPTEITGETYTVELFTFKLVEDDEDDPGVLTYRVLRNGEVVFDGEEAFRETGSLVRVIRNEEIEEEELEVDGARVSQTRVIDGLSFFTFGPPDVPSGDLGGITRFAGGANANGIVEVAVPGDLAPCEGVPTDPTAPDFDPGCALYEGNTVALDPNRTDEYFVASAVAGIGNILQADIVEGEDFEMRFTEECADAGNCLGVYVRDDGEIVSVPFELWNIGDLRTPDDDVRMIPVIRTSGDEPVQDFADYFPTTEEFTVGGETLEVGVTERVFFAQPDRPNGYELFAQDARSLFGGVGGLYNPDEDNDTQIDSNAVDRPCSRQGYYIDFCFRATPPFRFPIGATSGLLLTDLAGDGTTPEAGTTIRFLTAPKPVLTEGDSFQIDTAPIAFETGRDDIAQEALDLIGIVPNPYMGRSAYETNNLDRVVRFINLPDQATIRIYTVAGTLIRTLQKDGPSRSLDWDLNTHNQLPVASGMYLIHVDVPGVGEKVLKFGVVNRRNRITVF